MGRRVKFLIQSVMSLNVLSPGYFNLHPLTAPRQPDARLRQPDAAARQARPSGRRACHSMSGATV